jgi:hypothetical protein
MDRAGLGAILRHLVRPALAALLLAAAVSPGAAIAATLYISEFANGVSQVGSTTPQVYPQAAITDQTVALSGASAQSAVFNAGTHAVSLVCDEGCSVLFGTKSATNPAATTSNYLLQQGVPYEFTVVPGTKLAVIANAAGDTGGGGGGGGGAVTIADGADVTQGAIADAAATAGGTGTVSAKLRTITGQLATGSAGLLKAEDAAAASGDAGVMALGVRNDTGADVTSANGDYSQMSVDSAGNEKVVGNVAAAVADAGNPVKVGGVAMSTAPSAATDGQRQNAWMTPTGAFVVGGIGATLADGASNTSVAFPRTSSASPVGLWNDNYVFNGASWDRQRGDVNGSWAQGNVAADAVDIGNPVKTGCYAMGTAPNAVSDGDRQNTWCSTNGATVVSGIATTLTDGIGNTGVTLARPGLSSGTGMWMFPSYFNGTTWDRMRGNAVEGLVVKPYAFAASAWNYAAATGGITNTTTAVTIKAAAGSGVVNYITSLSLNSSAVGTPTEFVIRKGAGGTVLWRYDVSSTGLLQGINIQFPVPLASDPNGLLEIATLTATVTGSVYFNAQGYSE